MSSKQSLIRTYQDVRLRTEKLCQSLAIEDYVIQSHEDVSPPKWHLAHTTWFFETFVLIPQVKGYPIFHPSYHYLFNSYYHTIGQPYPRGRRGVLSRPTVANVYAYRHHVDEALIACLNKLTAAEWAKLTPVLQLGLHHEQQHQELLLMDIKYNFFSDPTYPVYQSGRKKNKPSCTTKIEFISVDGGLIKIGYQGNDFCFDNELPPHQQFLRPYQIASRLVTNGEFCEFIEAGGYQQANLWLADGWDQVQKHHWQGPLYWQKIADKWYVFTLHGMEEIEAQAPVSHVSYYEADAYASWHGSRLPSEAEWEHFTLHHAVSCQQGNFLESEHLQPRASDGEQGMPQQFFGDVWEWTRSSYGPYPGYQVATGALGEYNGKFMSNQIVLRGGSCVTPQTHMRATYRNFFQPEKRWQFSGIRLARDV